MWHELQYKIFNEVELKWIKYVGKTIHENQLYYHVSQRQVYLGLFPWEVNNITFLDIVHFIQYVHQYDSPIVCVAINYAFLSTSMILS